MSTEMNKESVKQFMERAFNHGDLSVIDEQLAQEAVDHQEPLGTQFVIHLKAVINGMRTAFPDLHFEIHNMVAEGEIVAFRSTMTGTHLGILNIGPINGVTATGYKIEVAHMHFIRMINGKTYDLWHIWDTPGLMRQLHITPEPPRVMQ